MKSINFYASATSYDGCPCMVQDARVVAAVYVLSMIVSAAFDKPIVVSLGFLVVAAMSSFGI